MTCAGETGFSKKFVNFIMLLRGLGLKAGIMEMTDALQALLLVDLMDKEAVYQVLRFTLVKDLREAVIFKQAFETFFVPEAEQEVRDIQEELLFQDTPLHLTPEQEQVYRQLSTEQKESIQSFLERSSTGKNVTAKFLPIVEDLVKGQLDYYSRNMPRLQPVELTGDAELDEMLWAVSAKLQQEEELLVHKDMANFTPEDMASVKRVVSKLTRRLATRLGRRKRRTNREGLPDLRRSIRHSIQHGGTIFRIRYRQKRKRKPDLVLLCDISGSMERYSTFVVQFCYALSRAFRRLETFFFSENLAWVTLRLNGLKNPADFGVELEKARAELGRGTDLGKSMQELLAEHQQLLGKQKTIFVVSDGKTTDAKAAARQLHKLSRQARGIFWLNPVARKYWNQYSAIGVLARHSTMVECSTLAQLNDVMHQVLLKG